MPQTEFSLLLIKKKKKGMVEDTVFQSEKKRHSVCSVQRKTVGNAWYVTVLSGGVFTDMLVHVWTCTDVQLQKCIVSVLFPRGKCQWVLFPSCCLGLWTVHDKGAGEDHGARGSNWDGKPHQYVKFCFLCVFSTFMLSMTGQILLSIKACLTDLQVY